MPWRRVGASRIRDDAPLLAAGLTRRWVDELLAAVLTLVGVYLIGWFATNLVGRQVIGFIERLKCVGLLMKSMTDAATGSELGTVYVPTAPNPTSGYLESVPIEHVIPTDWTVDEAMKFAISMGAMVPGAVRSGADPA